MADARKFMEKFFEKVLLLSLLIYFLMKITASITKLDQQGVVLHSKTVKEIRYRARLKGFGKVW